MYADASVSSDMSADEDSEVVLRIKSNDDVDNSTTNKKNQSCPYVLLGLAVLLFILVIVFIALVVDAGYTESKSSNNALTDNTTNITYDYGYVVKCFYHILCTNI